MDTAAFTEAGWTSRSLPIPSAGGQQAQPFVGVQGFYASVKRDNALLANDFLVNYMATEEVQTPLYEARRPRAGADRGGRGPDDPIIPGFDAAGATARPMPADPRDVRGLGVLGRHRGGHHRRRRRAVDRWDKMVDNIQAPSPAADRPRRGRLSPRRRPAVHPAYRCPMSPPTKEHT